MHHKFKPQQSQQAHVSQLSQNNGLLSEIPSLRLIFRELNKGNVFTQTPSQLIVSLPQPHLGFSTTDLSLTGPLCSWQYTSQLNSETYQTRVDFSWFVSTPTIKSHFEWPPTEPTTFAKRLTLTFPPELTFNSYTQSGGDALLSCPTVKIVQNNQVPTQFVQKGENFPYKRLGSAFLWNNTQHRRDIEPQDEFISNDDKRQNLKQEQKSIFGDLFATTKTKTSTHGKNCADDIKSYLPSLFHNLSFQSLYQQNEQNQHFDDDETPSSPSSPSSLFKKPQPKERQSEADVILTAQFVMNDDLNLYSVYQSTILRNFLIPVKVESIDLGLVRIAKTILMVAVPALLFILIIFGVIIVIVVNVRDSTCGV
jgi:hypothetical protein